MFITTEKTFKDLDLNEEAKGQLKEAETLLPGKEERSKKSFSFLFIGPAGSGKKTAAALLGNTTDAPVFHIPLSQVISKYIGETEKSLNKVFEEAADKNWILFFDEADALFGKRTEVKDSHDKYANIEADYLLQKIEDHPGPVIFSAQKKNNIDSAFIRRMRNVIHFTKHGDK